MIKYETKQQEVRQSMRYDLTRSWIRRRLAKGWSYDRIRDFNYMTDVRAECRIADAIYMGFIDNLDSIGSEGDTLFQRWKIVVDYIVFD